MIVKKAMILKVIDRVVTKWNLKIYTYSLNYISHQMASFEDNQFVSRSAGLQNQIFNKNKDEE